MLAKASFASEGKNKRVSFCCCLHFQSFCLHSRRAGSMTIFSQIDILSSTLNGSHGHFIATNSESLRSSQAVQTRSWTALCCGTNFLYIGTPLQNSSRNGAPILP